MKGSPAKADSGARRRLARRCAAGTAIFIGSSGNLSNCNSEGVATL